MENSKGKRKEKTVKAKDVKYKPKDDRQLSGYNKKQLLNNFKENGCNMAELENTLAKTRVPNENALEFMQKQIDNAEAHVGQQCSSQCYENNDKWLKLFKDLNIPQSCNFELGMVMNSIANNESHPSPSDFDGVDIKAVYKFLGSALLGLPQPKLNPESAEFLSSEFEMLVEEANSLLGTKEASELKKKLETRDEQSSTLEQKIELKQKEEKSNELLPTLAEEAASLSLDPLQLNALTKSEPQTEFTKE